MKEEHISVSWELIGRYLASFILIHPGKSAKR